MVGFGLLVSLLLVAPQAPDRGVPNPRELSMPTWTNTGKEIDRGLKRQYMTHDHREVQWKQSTYRVYWGSSSSGIFISDVFVYKIYPKTKMWTGGLKLLAAFFTRYGTPVPRIYFNPQTRLTTMEIRYSDRYWWKSVDSFAVD
jgi:hypothetical protein